MYLEKGRFSEFCLCSCRKHYIFPYVSGCVNIFSCIHPGGVSLHENVVFVGGMLGWWSCCFFVVSLTWLETLPVFVSLFLVFGVFWGVCFLGLVLFFFVRIRQTRLS